MEPTPGDGRPGATASLSLDRDAATPGVARRFVCDVLSGAGLDELADDCALATSELVTNALLHTDSPVRVTVQPEGDQVRVEVHDECPVGPVVGMLDPSATSGRGLLLVERLSQRWGMVRVPGAGKTVWFEMVAGVPLDDEGLTADQLLARWGVEDSPGGQDPVLASSNPPTPVRTVRLDDVPTRLLNASKGHLEELIRDLTLVATSPEQSARDSDELLDLADRLTELSAELVEYRNQIRHQAVRAAHEGAPTLTVELVLPLSLRPMLERYRDALDEADRHCLAGELLVSDCAEEHIAFRRWELDSVIAQLAD